MTGLCGLGLGILFLLLAIDICHASRDSRLDVVNFHIPKKLKWDCQTEFTKFEVATSTSIER